MVLQVAPQDIGQLTDFEPQPTSPPEPGGAFGFSCPSRSFRITVRPRRHQRVRGAAGRTIQSAALIRAGAGPARPASTDQQAWSSAWANTCGFVTQTAWSASTSWTDAPGIARASFS